MFQERLGNVLKSVPSNTGITEDILGHGNAEISYDSPVINLLERAWANNLAFNAQRFALKNSRDCSFLGGNITMEGYNIDPQ